MMKRIAFITAGAAMIFVGPPGLAADRDVEAVSVLAVPVDRGDVLSADLFEIAELAPNRARGAVRPEDADGLEARRNLAAGRIVRRSDLIQPQLVRRGDPVSIEVRSGTLTITSRGEALGSGAEGERVRVVTANSRTLEGIVAPNGAVVVPLH
ncbi:flagella basal body P-ring formation protein FlgA [Pacificimonas flava]|uniref:Flagella basal body P-ring formation protein FlgA n=2 Tax=Pacificimonas TaxID=1960290 RepID=A0A219B6X5_9SPHN|nr:MULTISPECIES: flagellar basal body P-ring formation chaperone FlgA [Pacificimonas]MBZ6379237.1 flagellar basal body P-ring formation protein FlgA [Pacificimonas aurantium]OWV33549.1 flagella basal body P-ring formation protein FlgA [Pacificimonas flava]